MRIQSYILIAVTTGSLSLQAFAGTQKTPRTSSDAAVVPSTMKSNPNSVKTLEIAGRDLHVGPVEFKDVPKDILKPCLDGSQKIAMKGERWNATDVVTPGLPDRRFKSACKHSEISWSVECEMGGIVLRPMRVYSKLVGGMWMESKREYGSFAEKVTCP